MILMTLGHLTGSSTTTGILRGAAVTLTVAVLKSERADPLRPAARPGMVQQEHR
jgi:hypothetical protein